MEVEKRSYYYTYRFTYSSTTVRKPIAYPFGYPFPCHSTNRTTTAWLRRKAVAISFGENSGVTAVRALLAPALAAAVCAGEVFAYPCH